jgi:peptide/nickel transport system permease protein
MPAVSLGLLTGAVLTRLTRASMAEVLAQEYLRTAQAKGLSQRLLLWRHALPNALIPVLTILGLQIGFIFGGAVLIETIFLVPGVGSYAFLAVEKRDYAQLQSTVIVIGAVFLTINLLVDVLYTVIDPRLRTAPR